MTHRSNYATFVDAIFGPGSATFDVTKTVSNHVIGALAHPNQFADFKANYEARLRRIEAAIQTDPTLREDVLGAVNRVAEDEWDGAYAELCALDYFLAAPQTGPGNIELDLTLPASDTLASEMGMQNANHDMRLKALGVSMDTKNLSDKTGQILEGIFSEFRKAKGIVHMPILPTYDHDDDFTPYVVNRPKLLAELVNGVDVRARTPRLESTVIPGLSYQFAWDPGAYTSESTYSAEEHATKHHTLLFGHIKKFSRVEPTVITYVIFPWSGERAFLGSNPGKFQTEFGRQFFNNYIGSVNLAREFNRKVKSDITAGDVTKYLSGVIFLYDKSTTAKDPAQISVDASFVWNKNAVHSLIDHPLDVELRSRGAVDRS
ncbi:tRNA-dependent cyclodipeptide synthase [Achromobacter ruhlandii]|uniref:tRNA-dependent cyclodipeptide synthase n=1 Tax=Achromobacter ruhlandii TaxID=72557 RepID=UPI0021F1B085|nr:tRNA-dependent cyclodipeptide synthase [Achromobacter ruhlandii]MCV6795644.1 tRNA-dependent cyclodipeptide synthase [Achromobacter ruhlandii]MCV6800592.1 tRNA-dependent cyclodipeptide synthase [Achromobacter ruhlandii]MCV6807284.1 tRNA-dependent cyclodipeptide synthase [Achromobacter ruhlandii]MCV6817579.1 tRNA-dependent cyclodipeptide synthase [Achromobacter ruhlandii]